MPSAIARARSASAIATASLLGSLAVRDAEVELDQAPVRRRPEPLAQLELLVVERVGVPSTTARIARCRAGTSG
jgi:hypothetical protein